MLTKRYLAGTAALIAAATVAVPTAHADGNGSFLSCLIDHGFRITDSSVALDVAERIQNDERKGMPRSQLLWNLENVWNLSPLQANVYVDCVYSVLVGVAA